MITKKMKRARTRESVKKTREKQQAAGMKTVSVALPDDVYDVLVDLREKNNVNYSDTITAAVRAYAASLRPGAKVIDYVDKPKRYPVKVLHFRLNPTTGRREFIKDYDDARHKDEVVLSLVRGDRFQINNPGNEHHGKVVEYTGCSADFETLHGKIDGQPVDFHADRLERVEGWSDQGQS